MQNVLADQKGKQGAGHPVPGEIHLVADGRRADLADPAGLPAGEVAPVGRHLARAHRAREATEAVYHFDKADVVVTLDADFLSCGPQSVRYSRDFANRRRARIDAEHADGRAGGRPTRTRR